MASNQHEPTLEKLRSIPLFHKLPEDALQHLLDICSEVDCPPGRVFTQPGTTGSGLYVIEEGEVTVEFRGGRTLDLGPGEFFGELALLTDEELRSARVRAKTEVRCLAISRADFRELVTSESNFAFAMLEALAHRLAAEIS